MAPISLKYLGKEYRRDPKGFVVRMRKKYYKDFKGCKPARTTGGADKPSNLKDKENWE